MLERISIITNYNQYESKRHFALELSRALEREGIKTELFDAQDSSFRTMPFYKIEEFSPDITLSFNSFLPDKEGKFLFDRLKIPHLSLLVDPAIYYLDMADSPYCLFGVVDQFDIEFLKGFAKEVFFLPHGVKRELALEKEEAKVFDAVFIGSCYDYFSLRAHWKTLLNQSEISLLETSIELFLNDNATSLYAALIESMNLHSISPKNMNFLQIFRFLDIYTRGFDRIQLVRSLKGVNVHIFGGSCEGDLVPFRGWKEYIADMPNITLHDPISYEESINVLKKSKISLNSSPFFKNGSHERMFLPPLLNTLVVTNDTLYTRQEFSDGKDILLFPPKGWQIMNERISSLLNNEEERLSMVARAKKKVLEKHTWDERAKVIKEKIPDLIKKIPLQN